MIPEELENNNFYFQYRPISRIIVNESNKSTPKYKDIDRLIESEFYLTNRNFTHR